MSPAAWAKTIIIIRRGISEKGETFIVGPQSYFRPENNWIWVRFFASFSNTHFSYWEPDSFHMYCKLYWPKVFRFIMDIVSLLSSCVVGEVVVYLCCYLWLQCHCQRKTDGISGALFSGQADFPLYGNTDTEIRKYKYKYKYKYKTALLVQL